MVGLARAEGQDQAILPYRKGPVRLFRKRRMGKSKNYQSSS